MDYLRKYGTLALVLLVLMAMAVGVVATDAIDPDLPDESVKPGANVNEIMGDDPDEDGYTGPITLTSDVNGSQQDEADPDVDAANNANILESYSLDGQPDNLRTETVNGWSEFQYYFAAGSTFHPAESAMGSDYNAGACVSAISATNQFFTVALDLPEGSRIDYLRLFYYDTNAADSSGSIRKYDAAGNTDILLTATSTGNAGYGSALSPLLEHEVENIDGGYALNWLPSVTGNTLRLCGMRVAYRLPN